jgi:hypothetical protein
LESKEYTFGQLKGFISPGIFFEELILVEKEVIKLLKQKISEKSKKIDYHFSEIASKLDLILKDLKSNNNSIY